MSFCFLITDKPKGTQDIWFIGDEFVARSGHVIEAMTKSYCYTNFEVNSIGGSSTLSNNPDGLARINNALIKAFKKFNRMPKIIVLVPENDVINTVKQEEFGMGAMYEEIISAMMRWFQETIKAFKDHQTDKSKVGRLNWPHILWIAPSLHDNYDDKEHKLRKKFTYALETVSKNKETFTSLRLKYVWDQKDNNLFSIRDRRFTPDGWSTIWASIDKTVEHFDRNIVPEIENMLTSKKYKFRKEETQGASTSFYEKRKSEGKQWIKFKRHH